MTLPDASLTVLVYSDDASTREKVRLALGRRPAADLPPVDYVEVDNEEDVLAELEAGGIDLAILDGEAWPSGGMGICRRAKDELDNCPPVLVLLGRRNDAWLSVWSRADGALYLPLDPVHTVRAVAALLRRALPAGGSAGAVTA